MDEDKQATSTLGERLLSAVRNLWKVTDNNTMEIDAIKRRLSEVESDMRGLKISRGRAISKSRRLSNMVAEADNEIERLRARLN